MNTNVRCLALGLLAAACDAQESTDYVGDPMWTMKGSLVAPEGVPADTQVAIKWWGDSLQLLEAVEVEGDFPAEFTLKTYEAPPNKAALSLDPFDMDAKIAFGNIVAVDPSAPLYPKVLSDDPSIPLEPGESLVESGEEPWLRGGVPAYLVAFVEGKIPEAARCLSLFAEGYNLVALREYTPAEVETEMACRNAADAAALAEYNSEHGTSYTRDDLLDEAFADVERAGDIKSCEMGCGVFKVHAEIVDTDRRVTMQLEREVEFVDWN
jgi:hypothetical protein